MRALLISMVLAVMGCAPDLRTDYPFDGALPSGNYLENAAQPDGTTLSTVDATNKTSYVYVDLDTADDLPAQQALDTNAWDLQFQRFKIGSNGGSSGPTGTVKVAVLKDQDFASLTRAPETGYLQDSTDTVFNSAEGGWYYYDLGAHKLVTVQNLFYVIESSDQNFFKLKMKSYYDDNGTAARMQFVWQKIDAPAVKP